ncbi:MAG: histidine utilization repressor [Deltaproteobacteria bacterium]|nr:MAG: histidine utilization repressor [Deltaproteobacteria bacterium]
MISSQTAPRALYLQVEDYILERIGSGKWPPDQRIPSENQLVKRLGVSRMTVNRALRELSAEGRLVRIQGVGSFAAHRRPLTTLFEIISIDKEIRSWGGDHTATIICLSEEKAFPALAAVMEISVGAPVFHSVILHKDRGRPLLLADRYVDPVSAPDYLKQDFTTITPTHYLLKTIPVADVEHIVEAVIPDDATCERLEMDTGEPCLVLHRQTWNGSRVATHSKFSYPGSRYRLGGRFKPLSDRLSVRRAV